MNLPSEHMEQRAVASWLRRRGIRFFAVPNGADVSLKERAKLIAEGLETGVPDLLIVDRGRRLALEMKSRDPGATTTPDQDEWLAHLEGEGWTVTVKWGAEEAIAWLRAELSVEPLRGART